jgi:diketogulonate reductase-like aldo/keto reductase
VLAVKGPARRVRRGPSCPWWLGLNGDSGPDSTSLALARVLAEGTDIAAIPGSRRRSHLEANARSAQMRLDDATRRARLAALSPHQIAGARTTPLDADIEL